MVLSSISMVNHMKLKKGKTKNTPTISYQSLWENQKLLPNYLCLTVILRSQHKCCS